VLALPLHAPSHCQQSTCLQDKEETIAPPTPVTILIIDDEPGIVSALAGLLERHGYIVSTAGNGALAWEHLHTQRDDVILCDMLMPEVDGQAFYTMLQGHDPSLCARVIFLTGDTLGEASTAFLHQCGQPWLFKPCGAAEVLRAIEQVLGGTDDPHTGRLTEQLGASP